MKSILSLASISANITILTIIINILQVAERDLFLNKGEDYTLYNRTLLLEFSGRYLIMSAPKWIR